MSGLLFLQDHQYRLPEIQEDKSKSTTVEQLHEALRARVSNQLFIAGIEVARLLEQVPDHFQIVWDITRASLAIVHYSENRLQELENESLNSSADKQVILCITTQRPGYPPVNSNKLVERENKERVILYARKVASLSDEEVARALFSMTYSEAKAAARGEFRELNHGLRLLLEGRTVRLLTSLKILCYGYLELAETAAIDRDRVNEARRRMGFTDPDSLRGEWQIAPEDLRRLKAKVSKSSWWLTPFSGSYSREGDISNFDFEAFSYDLKDEWEMAGGKDGGWQHIRRLIDALKTSLTRNELKDSDNNTVARIVADAYISMEDLY